MTVISLRYSQNCFWQQETVRRASLDNPMGIRHQMLRAGLAPLIAVALTLHQGQNPQVVSAALRSLVGMCYVGGGVHLHAAMACLDANLLPLLQASMIVYQVWQLLCDPS